MDKLIKVKPAVLPQYLALSLEANNVPMVWGSPGTGKSASVKAFAKQHNLKFIDIRLATHDPVDFSGLPSEREDGRATHKPFDMIPLQEFDDPIKDGNYAGYLLFLDEITQCKQSVFAAVFQLVLDRKIGRYDLHETVHIVAAGNFNTDKTGANALPTALASRMQHFWLDTTPQEWLDNVAGPLNYAKQVIGFIAAYPDELYKFNPEDESAVTFACNRTWEFVSNSCKVFEKYNIPLNMEYTNFFSGMVSSGAAARFLTFCELYGQIPDPKKIIADPLGTKLPEGSQAIMWATATSLVEHIKDQQTCDAIIQYILRFPKSFQVVFINMSIKRSPFVSQSKYLSKMLSETGKMLADLR